MVFTGDELTSNNGVQMTSYRVNDIYHTVQGEGAMTGVAMALVRLHGCDVGCSFCDTKETWAIPDKQVETLTGALGVNANYATVSADEIRDYVTEYCSDRWVMITGGEPMEQPLGPLVCAFEAAQIKVTVETSGTVQPNWGAHRPDWVTVSPKEDKPVFVETMVAADELKFVIGKDSDIERMETELQRLPDNFSAPVYLQPVSQSKKATQLCLNVVKASHGRYRLSVQVHKQIGVL